VSEAIRSDLNGIVIEIGNAPLNPIQLGSYVKPLGHSYRYQSSQRAAAQSIRS
jgi:hypothetical protein